MILSELFRAALRALRAHKLRSFLTLLGVIIGVTTITSVVGVISGLDRYVKEKVINLAPDVYVVTKWGIIQSRDEFVQALKRPPITWREYERIEAAHLPHIAQVAVEASGNMPVNNGAHRLRSVEVVGTTPNFSELFSLKIEAGRYFTEQENDGASNVAIIGSDTREELFPGMDPMGRSFLLRGLPFRVIGVLTKEGRTIGFDQDRRVYIPIQVYRKNFMASNDSLDLEVKAAGGVEGIQTSQDELRAMFRAMRHTSFQATDPFGIVTQEALQTLWRQISSAAFLLMTLVSSVSLGVGGIVIMNIMLVSVVERTPEIGVRLAIGARKRDIRWQFLLEAALLSLSGGMVGVFIGGLITWIVRVAVGFPAQLTVGIVFASVLVSTLVGLAAGFLPARRASNLVVIDAIRAE